MLVQRLKLFITELRKFASIKSFDVLFLSSLERTFFHLESNQVLTDNLLFQLKHFFLQRWNSIVDTSDDYTRGSNQGVNALCIELCIEFGAEYKESPLKLLTPDITNYYDLISLKPMSLSVGRHSLSWFILNDDGTNFINVLSWYIEAKRGFCVELPYLDNKSQLASDKKRLISNHTFATYVDLRSYQLRAFTLRELLRLRIKGDSLTTDFSFMDETGTKYSNFWTYLQLQIMPYWKNVGALPVHMLPSLLALVDIYFMEAKGSCLTGTFRSHVLSWANNLNICTVHDANNLYGQIIQVKGKYVYLIDVLLNFLHLDVGLLKADILGLVHFLGNFDASYVINHEALFGVYQSLKIGPSFGVAELKEDLIQLKRSHEHLEDCFIGLLDDLESKQKVDYFIIEKLINLFARHWIEIKNTKFDYRKTKDSKSQIWVRLAQKLSSNFLEVNYQHVLMPNEDITLSERNQIKKKYYSMYYTFYNRLYSRSINALGYSFGDVKPKLRNIPRQVLPDLLEILEAYFLIDYVEFKKSIDAWIVNLKDCHPNDVEFLYEQTIQVKGKPTFFIDALLEMRYGPSRIVEEIVFSILAWLCCFDPSFVSSATNVQHIYTSMKLGRAFDIDALTQRLKILASSAALTVLDKLNQILEVVRNKARIDQSVIDALSDLYKCRWHFIQGQENCYTRQQEGVNKEWIELAAALSGAQLIPQNYYRFLMPSVPDDIDPVKRVSIVHYPLDHYLISGASFDQLILLDNTIGQYMSDNSLMNREKFRESEFLYNCNLEHRVPLNREEHANLVYANHRFHKYIQLTQTPDIADQPIKLATLDALTALVEGSVFPRGVKFLFDYTEDELNSAMLAYDSFCIFYNQLPGDEKQRLDNQLIHFDGMCKSFKKLLFEIDTYQCIAKVGQFILQLIVDYLPTRKFSASIEVGTQLQVLGEYVLASVGLERMRLHSKHKTPSDAVEFEQRAYFLLFSILTQPFEFVMFNADTVSAFNYVNQTIGVAKELFTKIVLMINTNDFTSYSDLVYGVVRPALADNGLFSKIRSTKNRIWLESIENGSFFRDPTLHKLLSRQAGVSMAMSSRFFQFKSTDAIVPATKPQKAAPMPKSDNPDAAIKIVIIAGSR